MKLFLRVCLLFCLIVINLPYAIIHAQSDVIDTTGRNILLMDSWQFHEGTVFEGIDTINQGNIQWEDISLPHDFMIYHDFTVEGEAESGFLLGGEAWYQKTFIVDETLKEKQFIIQFEGVSMNASIYLNGHYLGYHPYAYTSFAFDLTDYLIIDGKTQNQLVVHVDVPTPNSRWYPGGGIYRDVTLSVLEPLHFMEKDLSIQTPHLEQGNPITNIQIPITTTQDNQNIRVIGEIYDESGQCIIHEAQTVSVSANQTKEIQFAFQVEDIKLWHVDEPNLYTLRLQLYNDEGRKDVIEKEFGYRYFNFDANTGFSLNGQPLKLKGVCLHHDQGSLGSALYRTSLKRQLESMKQMGANAIRVTHNPSPTLLRSLCNELGLLVIDEAFDTWSNPKNSNFYDYSAHFLETITEENQILNGQPGMTWAQYDVQTMVRDGRNDPCIILWSIGNEILGNIGGDVSAYPEYAKQLGTWVNELDTSRYVTIGDNLIMKDNPTQLAMDEAIINEKGIIGLNYANGQDYDKLHNLYPEWILYGSETESSYSSRGVYDTYGINQVTNEISAYGNNYVEWGNAMEVAWEDTILRDYVAGEFIWTGFDYLGEPEPWNGLRPGKVNTSANLPRSAYFGVVDTAGFEKDSYYFYQSQWNDQVHTLHMLPSLNEEVVRDGEGQILVQVYSDAYMVELFLNGESLGKQIFTNQIKTNAGHTFQTTEDGSFYLTWWIPYEEGLLEAKAYDANGNELTDTEGCRSIQTIGNTMHLQLNYPTYILENDLAYIEVEARDENQQLYNQANNEVLFQVDGTGELLATDNGYQCDLQSFQSNTRNLYHGKALGIVKGKQAYNRMQVQIKTEEETETIPIYVLPTLKEKLKLLSPFQ